MMSRALPSLIAATVASVLVIAAAPALAESALQLVPTLRPMYQQRIETIAASEAPRLILGGASVAPNYRYPWMVSLGVQGIAQQIGHFCGGVAVAPSWVLTAGHCVSVGASDGKQFKSAPAEAGALQILARSNVLFRGGQVKLVTKVVLHPQYRVTAERIPENDIALMQVSGEPNLTYLDVPAEARVSELLQDGTKVGIFGWGTASFDLKAPISNTLLYAYVDVVAQAKCNVADVYDGAVRDSMFCAGLGFADACQGDSGGPAVGYTNGVEVLVGITSWGVGCNSKKYPGVYANVGKFSGWIRETIAASK